MKIFCADTAYHLPSGEMPWSLFTAFTLVKGTGSGSPPVTGRRQSLPREFSSRYLPSGDQLGASKVSADEKITCFDLPSREMILTWLVAGARRSEEHTS